MFFELEPSMSIGRPRIHTEDSFTVGKRPANNVSEYRHISEDAGNQVEHMRLGSRRWPGRRAVYFNHKGQPGLVSAGKPRGIAWSFLTDRSKDLYQKLSRCDSRLHLQSFLLSESNCSRPRFPTPFRSNANGRGQGILRSIGHFLRRIRIGRMSDRVY